MVIDFHAHCWPDDLAQRALTALHEHMPEAHSHTDGTCAGLLREMDRAGVDLAVTLPVATKASQVEAINAAAAAQPHNRTIAFGAMHPDMGSPSDTAGMLAGAGVPGVKLHPEYQDFYVDDPRMDELYTALQTHGLIAVFHAGWDPGPFTRDHATPRALRRVHERFPRMPMVLAHMGGFMMWDEVREEIAGLPVWLDTSAAPEHLPPDDFVALVECHGADRVLFASDMPWFDCTASRRWVEDCLGQGAELDGIMGGNAAQLLGLSN